MSDAIKQAKRSREEDSNGCGMVFAGHDGGWHGGSVFHGADRGGRRAAGKKKIRTRERGADRRVKTYEISANRSFRSCAFLANSVKYKRYCDTEQRIA